MPDALRPVKWQQFDKFLIACGCEFVRQKGSHRVYKKAELLRPIIVPAHSYPISIGVIQANLRTLGVSKETFLDFISKKKPTQS